MITLPTTDFLTKKYNKDNSLTVFLTHHGKRMLSRLIILLSVLSLTTSFAANAGNLIETITGTDPNQLSYLQDKAISVGGWVSSGGTYSTNNPSNHNNAPISFNDRSGELQLNQLNLFLQKNRSSKVEKLFRDSPRKGPKKKPSCEASHAPLLNTAHIALTILRNKRPWRSSSS